MSEATSKKTSKGKKLQRIKQDKKQTDPEVVKPSAEDMELANTAFSKLKNIYINHYQSATLEAANYIAETFFDNKLELVKKKKAADGKKGSFSQLCKKLIAEDSGAPSKSWMYNALGLFIDNKALEGFQTYGKLSPSHKVKLLTVHDVEKKKELIKEIDKKNYSVRQLQDRISEVKAKTGRRNVKAKDKYLTQVKGIKSDLLRRRAFVKRLIKNDPDSEKYKELNETLTELITQFDEMIKEDKKQASN